jgi:hypothetical protein
VEHAEGTPRDCGLDEVLHASREFEWTAPIKKALDDRDNQFQVSE